MMVELFNMASKQKLFSGNYGFRSQAASITGTRTSGKIGQVENKENHS